MLTASEEAGQRVLDGLAEQVLEELTPLSFETARAPDEVDAVLRMRYECVVELGWASPEDYPDGRERDERDSDATFVICSDGGAIVASMRLVPPRPGDLLPVERDFGIRARPAGRVMEAGRIVVLREYRVGRSHRVLGGLCARGWIEARRLGYAHYVSTATPELIDLYRGLGMRITVLGPARQHWGEERVPIDIGGAEESFSFLHGDRR